MRKSFIFCLCVAAVAMFTACKDSEGVYNPSKKIQKIYSVDDGVKELEEIWNWDRNILTSIEDVGDTKTVFSYDKNNRLVAADVNNYFHTEFIYDGKYVQKMVTSENGVTVNVVEFEHENGKISVIKFEINEDIFFKMGKVNPMRFVLPEVYPVVEKAMKKYAKGTKGMQVAMKLNWTGDNVTSMEMTMPFMGMNMTETMEFTFDNMLNPTYGSFASLSSDVGEIFFLNKNNPLTMKTTVMGQVYVNMEYTYEYDGKYPTKIVCKTTDEDGMDIETTIIEY